MALHSWQHFLDPATQPLAFGSFGLLALRLVPLSLLAPWFTWVDTPWLIRLAIVVAVSVGCWPLAYSAAAVMPETPGAWLTCALHELTIGTLFALSTSIPLHALQWTGRLVDQWRGASFTGALSATDSDPSPLGQLLLITGVGLFIAVGGHRMAISIFADSLQRTPPLVSSTTSWPLLALGSARLVADGLKLAAILSAPFIAVLLMLEMALAVVDRVGPHFPVSAVSVPLRAALALLVLAALLGVLTLELPEIFGAALQSAKTWLQYFAK